MVHCLMMCTALLLSGCLAPETQHAPNPRLHNVGVIEPLPGPKNLLVFLDGTANEWKSRTHVRRLFEMIGSREDPTNSCFYVDGVGNLSQGSLNGLLGGALGWRMKTRILSGYEFLSENWKSGDKIFIFGFSRGAHQARALAGMIAHCGLLDPGSIPSNRLKHASRDLWGFCIAKHDITDPVLWDLCEEENVPVFGREISTKLRLATRRAEINFLGVWDTVPGSQLKSFSHFEELEDARPGIRYKLRPYPPIREIAHALALDERRSKFRPVLFSNPINPSKTVLSQEWFAGAHSDVGGGYDDNNELAGVTFNWMLRLLDKHHLFPSGAVSVHEHPLGLAHEPLYDWPNNFGSKPEVRWRPADAKIHESVQARTHAERVITRIRKRYTPHRYRIREHGEEIREGSP